VRQHMTAGRPSISRRWQVAVLTALTLLLVSVNSALAVKPDTPGGKTGTDEVTTVTVTSEPVLVTDTYYPDQLTLSLDPATQSSFTQKAGEVVLVSAQASMQETEGTNFCGIEVRVIDSQSPGDMNLRMTAHTNKGEYGELADSTILVAPATDTPRSFEGWASMNPEDSGCDTIDEFDPPEGPAHDDAWTVSLRVSITTLRE
jgi:hypothetical protein